MMIDQLQALSNDKRLLILEWLKDPQAFFPRQIDGDLVHDGVCAVSIAHKLGISQPTLSVHMKVLVGAGLVTAKRVKQWTFYQRDENSIARLKKEFARNI